MCVCSCKELGVCVESIIFSSRFSCSVWNATIQNGNTQNRQTKFYNALHERMTYVCARKCVHAGCNVPYACINNLVLYCVCVCVHRKICIFGKLVSAERTFCSANSLNLAFACCFRLPIHKITNMGIILYYIIYICPSPLNVLCI